MQSAYRLNEYRGAVSGLNRAEVEREQQQKYALKSPATDSGK